MGREPATTVVIVGAGPAGLVLAQMLHREGIAFTLLERRPQADLRALAKAGIIEHRTVELLTAEGIAPSILRFEATNGSCEFRTPDDRVVFDYGAITGGRPHYVFPQHELVAQLCEALVAAGADIRFEATVERVAQDDAGATVTVTDADGRPSTLTGAAVVCCDGARSLFADAIPDARVVERSLPVRWLAVIGTAPPLVPHTIYAAHPRGFAGHMRRGPTQTRYYLEVFATDALSDWPEARIRAELTERLCLDGELDAVGFVDASLLDLRMRVIDPIQHGRVFLAGDAAHLITPAGGKGMNLAIQDAVELAHGLIERGQDTDGARLEAYSATRLPAIWRTQAFSSWMLRLILAGSEEPITDGGPTFGRGLRQGWISALQHDPLLATWFAHAYAGADVLPA